MNQPVNYNLLQNDHEEHRALNDPYNDLDNNLSRPMEDASESSGFKACLKACGGMQMFCSWFGTACGCGPLKKIT